MVFVESFEGIAPKIFPLSKGDADGGVGAAEDLSRNRDALAFGSLFAADDSHGDGPGILGFLAPGGGEFFAEASAGLCLPGTERECASDEDGPAVAAAFPHRVAVFVVVGELEYRQASEALAGDVFYSLGGFHIKLFLVLGASAADGGWTA